MAASHEQGVVTLRCETPQGDETLTAGRLIAGTGFRPAVDRLEFIDGSLRAEVTTVGGAPALDRSFECSYRGSLRWLPCGPELRPGDAIRVRGGFRRPAGCAAMPRSPVTAQISPELGKHGQHWNRLAADSASPFLSSEWLCAWWSAYGRGSSELALGHRR